MVFAGPGGAAARHAHHAVQLVWSLDGELTVTFDAPVRRRATLIPAGVPHAFDATGQRVILVLVEAHGARGRALDRRARATLGAELGAELAALPAPRPERRADTLRWADTVLAAVAGDAAVAPLSAISRRAIAYVESEIGGKPVLADAARRARVSPTRLTHVFSREVGIPFRRFVLWTRIKRAVMSTQAGRDLTRAAIDAGFSDSAHLSRTFRAMFGLSPSVILATATFKPPP